MNRVPVNHEAGVEAVKNGEDVMIAKNIDEKISFSRHGVGFFT
jgi:hypothetical protein